MKTAARRRAHGLSLIELMISIAIVTVIGGYLAYFLVIGASAWRAGDAEIQANQESRRGMMSMVKELRQAQDGNLRTTAGALYADNTVYNNIKFPVIADTDGDGDTVSTIGALEWSTPISYYISGTQLIRSQDGATTVLANNVIGLQFIKTVNITLGISVLNVTLQTRKTSVEGRQVQSTLTCSIKIRN
ncbi:MAG: prepilin-type N-terminal cleavage/methylation domain-containing protein [Candidatus Omnitrophica bacterium]|nr:prepilin-type N-terminal cleavage/methylation domain-containing protein [Candidatus Omnitrophota bacterium]MDD5737335.1 prepilin-type N-terminal cleavage/methylation domain-containing protein [Candidatus Omnitrophota bacterium]